MAGFFDKVKDGLNKGVATAGAHSKAMMEKSKINAVISNQEKERLQLVQMLGQKTYDMYKAQGAVEADESIVNFACEIDKRLDAIATQREQLKRVEEELLMVTGGGGRSQSGGGAFCTACGFQNAPDAMFCAGCGGQVAAAQTSAEPSQEAEGN